MASREVCHIWQTRPVMIVSVVDTVIIWRGSTCGIEEVPGEYFSPALEIPGCSRGDACVAPTLTPIHQRLAADTPNNDSARGSSLNDAHCCARPGTRHPGCTHLTKCSARSIILPASGNRAMPKWRNWQTRYVQGVVRVTSCGFKSHLRHHAGG